jgi:hypothetical protein
LSVNCTFPYSRGLASAAAKASLPKLTVVAAQDVAQRRMKSRRSMVDAYFWGAIPACQMSLSPAWAMKKPRKTGAFAAGPAMQGRNEYEDLQNL